MVQEGARIPDGYLPANLDARAVGLHDEAREGFAGWSPGVRISAGEQEVPGRTEMGVQLIPNIRHFVAKMLSGLVHICIVQEIEW